MRDLYEAFQPLIQIVVILGIALWPLAYISIAHAMERHHNRRK